MTDQIAILIPRTRWKEGSAFVATAYFRDRATAAADAPSTVKYRVDCKTTGREIQDWTTISAAASVSIPITPTHNAIQSECNAYEDKQLTVSSDHDTADQCREAIKWRVDNLLGS